VVDDPAALRLALAWGISLSILNGAAAVCCLKEAEISVVAASALNGRKMVRLM
jgi:hypothetical protein